MSADELRALDAEVHRKVMGADPHATDMMLLCESGNIQACLDCDGKAVPAYSTDIAAAWQVVERLCADNRHTISVHDSTAGADCTVTRVADGHYVFACEDDRWSSHARAPLAICLAALKASAK